MTDDSGHGQKSVTFNQNGRSRSVGMTGHVQTESAVNLVRNTHKFLGYSVTVHRESRLRIAPVSVQRLMQRVRDLMRTGRGRSLVHTIEELNPLLRG